MLASRFQERFSLARRFSSWKSSGQEIDFGPPSLIDLEIASYRASRRVRHDFRLWLLADVAKRENISTLTEKALMQEAPEVLMALVALLENAEAVRHEVVLLGGSRCLLLLLLLRWRLRRCLRAG